MGLSRIGVVKSNDKIKDFYLVPLRANEPYSILKISPVTYDRILGVLVLMDDGVLSSKGTSSSSSSQLKKSSTKNDNSDNVVLPITKSESNVEIPRLSSTSLLSNISHQPAIHQTAPSPFPSTNNYYNTPSIISVSAGIAASTTRGSQIMPFGIPQHTSIAPSSILETKALNNSSLTNQDARVVQPPIDPRIANLDPSIIGQMLNSLLQKK